MGESGWQLSHGERSRLFIAGGLMQEPSLQILDESLGALDPEMQGDVLACICDARGPCCSSRTPEQRWQRA